MASLVFGERPAAGAPRGLLVLHHGRGTSEHDLLPLADVLDPERRLHVVAPRAPLQLPGAPGYHWEAHGFDVDYRESEAMHNIDPGDVRRAISWIEGLLAR